MSDKTVISGQEWALYKKFDYDEDGTILISIVLRDRIIISVFNAMEHAALAFTFAEAREVADELARIADELENLE